MPPFNSSGGDLVDQIREWFDRLRERFAGQSPGGQQRQPERRTAGGRRSGMRVQAVPLGAARHTVSGRTARHGRGRNDRAALSLYTWVLGAVLVIGVIALFFALRFVFDSSGGTASTTPTPQPSASPLPGPAAISSPPPFVIPSPSPSPTPPLSAAPQQRVHVVEGGDTLNRIAQRYGVTVEGIMQANGFTDRNRILRIGERLMIPDAAPGSPVPR
ncbi:MAG: LysM peptidoglycan-binding domain-containing protein [Chloroflexota bacterium]